MYGVVYAMMKSVDVQGGGRGERTAWPVTWGPVQERLARRRGALHWLARPKTFESYKMSSFTGQ